MSAAVKFHVPDIGDEEKGAVVDAMSSGWLTTGPITKEFEQKFADAVGAKYAVACNSATAGVLALFIQMKLQPSEEIIFPVWTFSSPAMMADMMGAKVVFVDVGPHTYMPTLDTLKRATNLRTRAIVLTHFGGLCHPEINMIRHFCKLSGVALIEDAAHAFPTRTFEKGCWVGGPGPLATFFSFYATKTLTTGEGGMITTEWSPLADDLRMILQNGLSKTGYSRYLGDANGWAYDVKMAGIKGNMPDTAAAMGLVQLRRSGLMRTVRAAIALEYENIVQSFMPGCECVNGPNGQNAWHLFPLKVASNAPRFIHLMAEKGVACSKHFIPMHKHTYWKRKTNGKFPNADKLHDQEVSLPIYSGMSHADIEQVCVAMKRSWGEM